MTDTAQAWRPSPRRRPADAPSRPGEAPRLHVVPPAADLQSETEAAENTPLDHVSAGQDLAGDAEISRFTSAATGLRLFAATSRAYWTPPSIFTDAPATLEELAAYAKHAPWTAQDRGLIRAFGIGYYRFVGYPYTVISRYREWFAQRPLRLATLLGGVKLAALTGPGQWVVHTVVYPAAQFAGHIFL
jgi:hypothetical protein